jgi:acetyltransferase EpsM
VVTQKLVILGGSGDGLVVAQAARDCAAATHCLELAGFLDDRVPKGQVVFGAAVLGALRSWRTLPADVVFVPALHKVGEMPARARLISELGIPPERWASVVHPTACIAGDVSVGAGSFIASYVTIQPGARVGKFVSVRAGANVGHDAALEDFTYMGPNATLSGRSCLAEGAHLGPNAAVVDRLTVGRYAVVGVGSAVTKNVEPFAVCMGNPARRIRSLRDTEAGRD